MYQLNRHDQKRLQRLLNYREWLNAHWWQGVVATLTRPYEWTLEQRFKWSTRLDIQGLVWDYWRYHNATADEFESMNVKLFYEFILKRHLGYAASTRAGIERYLNSESST